MKADPAAAAVTDQESFLRHPFLEVGPQKEQKIVLRADQRGQSAGRKLPEAEKASQVVEFGKAVLVQLHQPADVRIPPVRKIGTSGEKADNTLVKGCALVRELGGGSIAEDLISAAAQAPPERPGHPGGLFRIRGCPVLPAEEFQIVRLLHGQLHVLMAAAGIPGIVDGGEESVQAVFTEKALFFLHNCLLSVRRGRALPVLRNRRGKAAGTPARFPENRGGEEDFGEYSLRQILREQRFFRRR